MLVVKQKTNTRKKKAKSYTNSQKVHQKHGNNNFSGCNYYNKRISTKTNHYSNNKFQNTRSDFDRFNNSSSSNQLNQSYSSPSKSHSDLNRNGFSHNADSSYGYVTDKLRSVIERYILENQMVTFCIIVIICVNCHVTDKHSFIKLLLSSYCTTCLLKAYFLVRLKYTLC